MSLSLVILFDLIRFYYCLFWPQPLGFSTTTKGTRFAASQKIQSYFTFLDFKTYNKLCIYKFRVLACKGF
ncbi:hypothetical protein GLYMA_02G004500v4 [Glycine max]|uniref:Uncharacterized protein n=1 Tax=Glycine max TaxID=3847 RepID=A0A0R0KZ50_SOYBN|nr:hypothetical protein JHK85_002972 [Glycine max]KAH1058095.1 hypothetical protein GYH30_002595 [Glycine max]KRH69108.1 hypothetical protein GLYMA_02G004500v4 [Glycine max]